MKHLKTFLNHLKTPQQLNESSKNLNISEVRSNKILFDEYIEDIVDELNKRFDLTTKEIDEIIDWYRSDIEEGFFGGKGYVNVKTLVNSFVVDGKLKWKR